MGAEDRCFERSKYGCDNICFGKIYASLSQLSIFASTCLLKVFEWRGFRSHDAGP